MAAELTSTDTDTAPDQAGARPSTVPEPRELGLVIVSCPDASGYVGAWLAAGEPGDDRVLGRGAARSTDRLPRMVAVQQRPGVNQALGPLPCPRVSRVQLEVASCNGDLSIRNVGSASVLVNGTAVTAASVGPGDLVELGTSLMLLCTERPRVLAPIGIRHLHDFGEPDAAGMVGESPTAWNLRRTIHQMAKHTGHLIVQGPTGSGKELVVRSFCALVSPDGRVVERNAATLPEGLIDAELFGNLKNYPNAGMPERHGLVGESNGGVLFLDEIAELPHSAQTHLLRVLDSGSYQRLGESTVRSSNFRLVAATNRPLSTLRDDVLARFTLRLEVPPLAMHPEDLPLILRHLASAAITDDAELCSRLLDSFGRPRFSRDFLRNVLKSPLPANARELRHLTLLSVMQSKGDELEWPELIGTASDDPSDSSDGEADDDEAERIQKALDENNGSIEKTWRALGLGSRFALMRRLKKHKLVVRKKSE